jgi:hypothetical protein
LGCSCIFVERAKREERGRALRRETAFAGGGAHIPRQTAGTNYEAANINKYQSVQYKFEGLYNIYCAQKLRRIAAQISGKFGMHSKVVVQYFSGTEIEEGVGHDFLSKENPYNSYGLAQKTRVVLPSVLGTIFKVLCTFFKAFA